LQGMSRAAMAVADGDYRQTLKLNGPQEVQNLAQSFNAMVDKVQTSQQIQRDFLANVSHELKTPLTSIQGFAQAMLDGAVEDTEARDHAVRVIFEESDRLRRLVEDLLDLARIDAGQIEFKRQPIDLQALLGSVVDKLILPAKEKGVVLENRLDAFPTMIGDGDRLAQVFTNLVDNAIKHTPPDRRVIVHGNAAQGWISIHVDDSGSGIPNEDLSRIFERFYQVDKARRGGKDRGVGLGLAISRQIVEAHGGRIVAQSTVGKGSRFTVQLPIVQPDDETLVHGSL
jgi:signal transduction histidine kinase